MRASATPISFALRTNDGMRGSSSSRPRSAESAIGSYVDSRPPWRTRQTRASAITSSGPARTQPPSAAEILVQRDVDRVEQRRDLAQRPAVERPALPQPRAVEVQRDAVRARPARPARAGRATPEAARRDRAAASSSSSAPSGSCTLVEIGARDQTVATADRARVEAVQVRVAALLVHVEVALRMEADGRAAAPLAPDPQRDLLRHRAARKQRGRLLAEQLGDPRLEALDALAAAVDVEARAGPLRERTKRLGRIARRRPCGDEALAARDDPLAFP